MIKHFPIVATSADFPDWWVEVFPNTYMEYRPIQDEYEFTVYFRMGGHSMRLDPSIPAHIVERLGSWDAVVTHLASLMFKDLLSLTDLTSPPYNGYGHLVWDNEWKDWKPQVDKPTGV